MAECQDASLQPAPAVNVRLEPTAFYQIGSNIAAYQRQSKFQRKSSRLEEIEPIDNFQTIEAYAAGTAWSLSCQSSSNGR